MNSLNGTGSLVRLALRRERIGLTAWIVVVVLVVTATAASFESLYPTVQSRTAFAETVTSSPALLALTGPAFDLSTIGGLTAWRTGGISAVLVGLLAVFTVVRHTRADEEAGRLELVGSAAVGRRAPLAAALLVVFAAGIVLGLLVGLSLIAQGLPTAGSFTFGLGLACVCWVFAAVTAVAAQLSENARVATGIASTVLGVSFVLRAVGDSTGPSWLNWFSPIGWSQQLRAFAGERWCVFAPLLGLTVILVGVAQVLVAKRDLGAGLVATRPGPAAARPGLRSAMALAWRLHRGSLAAWSIAFAVVGAMLGGLAESVADILKTSTQITAILAALGGAQGAVDTFLSAVLGIMGLVAGIYAVQSALRLRTEETGQRAEPLLTAGVGRIRWAVSHLVFPLLGTTGLMVIAGLAIGLTHGLRIDDVGTQLPRILGAALVQVPAAWVLAGIASTLFGLMPRLVVLAWGALVAFLLLGQLGSVLRLSQWALDISPFTHLPKLPGGQFTATPILWLIAVTVVLTTAGLLGFRRRDVG